MKSKVLTDGVHLVCLDLNELHRVAQLIGLRREWFQAGVHPHYNLLGQAVTKRAFAAGVWICSKSTAARVSRESTEAHVAGRTGGDGENTLP